MRLIEVVWRGADCGGDYPVILRPSNADRVELNRQVADVLERRPELKSMMGL